MMSIGSWRWYINIIITILDVIQGPFFYLRHNVSETEFFLRLQVQDTQLCPIDRASCCCSVTESSFKYWAQLSSYHLDTETESSLWNSEF
jgi:hypothetical protein